jgi:uncharacterized protein YigE (DUF2233 family)
MLRIMQDRKLSLPSRYARCGLLAALLCMPPAIASALVCGEVVFRDLRSTVCRVDIRTDRLQLFLTDPSGRPFNSFQKVAQSVTQRNEQLVFAMNAGMYREDYSPLGLMVINGHQVHRLNVASGFGNFYMKPNGIFIVSDSGAHIIESSQYQSLQPIPTLATQSGPLLLHDGQLNSHISPQGTSRLIRNGVGIVRSDEVVFVISEDPVNFYDFALLFRDRLHCADALYLDGNVSSLYVRSLGRADEHVPLGPIIGVTIPTHP